MDTNQAKLEIDKWIETLTLREKLEWFRLGNKRINYRTKVNASVVELKYKLREFNKPTPGRIYWEKNCTYVSPLETTLSHHFNKLKSYIEREVQFLPESLREAYRVFLGDWSTAAINILADANEYLNQGGTYHPPEEEEEVIQLSSSEDSESESEFKSEEEETDNKPHPTPKNLHTKL